jgi:hypothetical protein
MSLVKESLIPKVYVYFPWIITLSFLLDIINLDCLKLTRAN